MMFASVLPDLALSAKRIIFGCQPALVRLFNVSFSNIEVRPHALPEQPMPLAAQETFDFQTTIGSLMQYQRPTAESFVGKVPYLAAAPEDVQAFKLRLQLLIPEGRFKVGLMWGSNPATSEAWSQRRAQQKSVPIAQLQALVSGLQDQVSFVSLQNGLLAHEAALGPQLQLVTQHEYLLDMADTAALIANLDLVISVDTSVAHLAGAMGKPVWVLLKQRCDWRWLAQGRDSYWYPSARLFRQSRAGCWDDVIAQVAAALASEVS